MKHFITKSLLSIPFLFNINPIDAFSIPKISKVSPITQIHLSYLDSLTNPQEESQYSPIETTTTTTPTTTTSFNSLPQLTLEHADTIANNIITCCKRNNFAPVTVFILDAWGSTLVSKRMDGCSPVGIPDFARAKAYSCVVNKYPSRVFRDRYTADEASAKFGQMLGMVAISQGQMAPFPGGILLKLGEDVIGSVGVSGAAGDEDEYCAIRGVVESGFGIDTVPENHSCSTVQDRF